MTETQAGTPNRRMLAAIEALIEGKSVKDIQYYMINGRQLTKIPISDLIRLQAVYTKLVLSDQGQLFGSITIES